MKSSSSELLEKASIFHKKSSHPFQAKLFKIISFSLFRSKFSFDEKLIATASNWIPLTYFMIHETNCCCCLFVESQHKNCVEQLKKERKKIFCGFLILFSAKRKNKNFFLWWFSSVSCFFYAIHHQTDRQHFNMCELNEWIRLNCFSSLLLSSLKFFNSSLSSNATKPITITNIMMSPRHSRSASDSVPVWPK